MTPPAYCLRRAITIMQMPADTVQAAPIVSGSVLGYLMYGRPSTTRPAMTPKYAKLNPSNSNRLAFIAARRHTMRPNIHARIESGSVTFADKEDRMAVSQSHMTIQRNATPWR